MRVLLIAAAILVYLTSFRGIFLFDDQDAIIKNPNIRALWPLQDAVSARPQSPVAGRPLAALSLALNYAVGGLDPWGYHLFNLAVHILAGLTLFGVVHRTLAGPRLRDRYGPSAQSIAAAVALLWLVHPLQTESVTYITQRTESLMGLFYLLTLYCAIRGGERPSLLRWPVAGIVTCALGMASKEVMVTVPILVLLHDAFFGAGSIRRVLVSRPWFYGGLAATWIILAVSMASGPRSESVGFSQGVPMIEYAKNQCEAVANYLRLAFWPHPLLIDYGLPRPLAVGEIAPYALVLALLLAGTTVALLRRRAIGFPATWFFLILAPTSTLVPIATEVAAERRMYLPLAGVIMIAVIAAHRLLDRFGRSIAPSQSRRRTLATVLVVLVAIALGYTTSRRNTVYADVETLWRQAAAARPWNARALCGVAAAVAARGDQAEAAAWYEKALTLNPHDPITHNNLGGVLANMGRYDEAVAHFAEAVRLNPRFIIAQTSLGNALRLKGDLQAAVAAHHKAIEIDPAYGDAWYNLGLDLDAQGDKTAASDAFAQALRLNSSHKGAQAAVRASSSRPTGQ